MKTAGSQSFSEIHAASWLISPHAPPLSGGAILVRNGLIAATGALSELKRSYAVPVVEHPGCAIVPGFVNSHTHLELTHFPSWKIRTNVDYQPRRFVDWIIQLIKVKRSLQHEDYCHSVNEGIRICLESGTTAIGEIVTDASLVPLYAFSPLSGKMYLELLGHDPARFNTLLDKALLTIENRDNDGFAYGLSPHSAYTIGEDNLPLVRQTALAHSLPLSIHLSESEAETEFIFSSTGSLAEDLYHYVGWEQYLTHPRKCSSTELFDRAGLLTSSTMAVHCVRVSHADAEILRKRGVTVALCPRSNEMLDVGQAPVALLKKAGIPLVLGTDSLASNNSLSLWDEMRFALNTFPRDLTPSELFQMVTVSGATALGLAGSHGSLECGKRADFQIIGNIGDSENPQLEAIIYEGIIQDVYLAGIRNS